MTNYIVKVDQQLNILTDTLHGTCGEFIKLDAEDELVDRLKHRVEITTVGKFYHNCNGELHREGGPAACYKDGSKWWYRNNELHREDGPAVEHPDGTKEWFLNGELHREGGPAVEWANGDRSWYQHGVRHREDGPALVLANGFQEWWVNGILQYNQYENANRVS